MGVLLNSVMVKLDQVVELNETNFDQMEAPRGVNRHRTLLSGIEKRVDAKVLSFFEVSDVSLFHISLVVMVDVVLCVQGDVVFS